MAKSSPSRQHHPLADLPSLGPVSAGLLVEAGIPDVDTLHRLGPIACYRQLRFHHGRRITTNFMYALECAVRGIDWRALDASRKDELKRAARAVEADLASAQSGRRR